METIGIEKLKKAIGAVFALGETVSVSLEDQKISVGEWGKIAMKGVGLAIALKDFAGLKVEFKNLTEDEKDQLVLYVQEEFDIPNDNIEAMIEQAFEILFKFATGFVK